MLLTQFAIQKAEPRDTPYKLPDGNGLFLLIKPNGKKQWRFRYFFAGKENMLAFGTYPEITLASARRKRDEARTFVAEGIDPSLKRKADKMAVVDASRNTFGVIATEYLEHLKEDGRAQTTMEKNTWLLNDLAKPLHQRPIKEITAAEILALLRKVEKTGRRETTRRLRGAIGSVFRYAIATVRADYDPTFALRGALLQPIVTHRPAITDEKKFGALMASIDEYDGWPTIKAAVQYLALTMTRPGDVRFMRRSEVNFIKATWSIPAERMKMRRPHDVPLSKQALTVLRSVWELTEKHGYVFPAIRSLSKPLSEVAMNSALRRLGYGKDAIKINPSYAGAARDRGITNADKREYDVAVAEADTAIKIAPNYAVAANNRVSVYESRREDDRVIQEVNQTIKSSAAPSVAYYNRANMFYGTRDYTQAIKFYNQAIKLQPDNTDALNQRCGARAIVGELKAALEDCNAALTLKPNNATALDHRGMAYLKLGQPDQALIDYDEALKLTPNSPAALYGRGVAKLMKGDVAASNADFEVAKEIKPSIAEEFTKVGVKATKKSFFQ